MNAEARQDLPPDLRHLAFSTRIRPEVCEYPGSGKVFAFAGFGEPARNAARLDARVHRSAYVDHWDGEA